MNKVVREFLIFRSNETSRGKMLENGYHLIFNFKFY